MSKPVPAVMCFSGLDPTGGAGIQADIEAIVSMGAHPCPVITAQTVQDTSNVIRYVATDPILLVEQARAVLDDIPVHAFKLGMLAEVTVIESIHSILIDYPDCPVVFDPVLTAGGGAELSRQATLDAIHELILPLTTVITPNGPEARRLAPQADSLPACASALQDAGCEYVLITGGHEQDKEVINTLYGNHRVLETFHWTRLPYEYHGSGCTLSASLAALLAHGLEPFTAANEAQNFTWHALEQAWAAGMGQRLPNRFFWARDDDDEQ